MQFVVGEQQVKVGYFISNLVYMQCSWLLLYFNILYLFRCKLFYSHLQYSMLYVCLYVHTLTTRVHVCIP